MKVDEGPDGIVIEVFGKDYELFLKDGVIHIDSPDEESIPLGERKEVWESIKRNLTEYF